MHILITRPEMDAKALATELATLGHKVTIEPLLQVTFLDVAAPDLDGAQALLFTSANGVRAFARLATHRDIAVFTVGEATAKEAIAAGFQNVTSAKGDVASLGESVAAALAPSGGRLVHIAGSVQAGDLAGDLSARGYNIDREVLYETHKAQSLSPDVMELIKRRDIDIILFFSPRTAQSFIELIEKHNLNQYLDKTIAACLSVSVQSILQSLAWRRILTANHPTLADLLMAAGIKTPS